MSNEAHIALDLAFTMRAQVEWTSNNTFRVWYQKPAEDGLSLVSKEYVVKEEEVL